ncbi:patatin-like phospholipase family protein [uncultured Gimesia sp.]|uniref:patatin-like phospholipase family protein n=1 Tax=uncultured Gimesia sp. TaxID=1678688 RepID=UPI0030DC5957|tara:strand:- start:209806 stop:210777 length:972 start_codon:yes stop_codon:yes gene_type:complete
MSKPYRILSLDGGGIRGLITAIWLKRLQAKLDKPLYKYFDLIAGTSAGALTVSGISKGISIDKIIELYLKRGKEIFPSTASRLWSRATRLFSDGVSAPKYDGEGLEKVLKDTFKTTIFGSLKIKPTLITAYDVFGREAIVLKNNQSEYRSLKVWEICKASASAPTYFPAHMMEIKGVEMPLIDGGVVANNPTACAIAEAVKINTQSNKNPSTDNLLVASFGTGESIRRITAEEADEWGAAEWAIPIINVLFDGSADSVNYIATQLIHPDRYFRFQTHLSDAYDDLDNADETNLKALQRLAVQYIDSNEEKKKLDNLVAKLTGN